MSHKHVVPARSPKAKDNRDGKTTPPTSATDDLIASLCGSCKGDDSLVDGLHQERQEKSFAERSWGSRGWNSWPLRPDRRGPQSHV